MRSRDKRKNIDRANYLAEQRYLKSKGLVTETSPVGPPNVAQEKDRPRHVQKQNPPQVGHEPDRPQRPKHVQKQNPPQVGHEPDRPQRPKHVQKQNPVDEATLTEGAIDPNVLINMIEIAGEWVKGGGVVSVGGESIPKNLATIIMSVMPTAAATAFIAQFWDEIKSKLGLGGAGQTNDPVTEAMNEYPNSPEVMEKVVDDIYQTVKDTGSRNIEISDQTWQMIEILKGL